MGDRAVALGGSGQPATELDGELLDGELLDGELLDDELLDDEELDDELLAGGVVVVVVVDVVLEGTVGVVGTGASRWQGRTLTSRALTVAGVAGTVMVDLLGADVALGADVVLELLGADVALGADVVLELLDEELVLELLDGTTGVPTTVTTRPTSSEENVSGLPG